MISRIYPEALMHIHTKSSFISHAGSESMANKQICRHFTECSWNNKAQLLSLPDNECARNCIFMVIYGNSRPDNSQSSNSEKWKVLNNITPCSSFHICSEGLNDKTLQRRQTCTPPGWRWGFERAGGQWSPPTCCCSSPVHRHQRQWQTTASQKRRG